jgi:hypothetical protein
MASVQNVTNCPHCGAQAFSELYCNRSRRFYVTCDWCGYYYCEEVKDDEFITRKIIPYASVGLKPRGSGGMYFQSAKREADLIACIADIQADRDEYERAYYRRYVDGVWSETDILSGESRTVEPAMVEDRSGRGKEGTSSWVEFWESNEDDNDGLEGSILSSNGKGTQ